MLGESYARGLRLTKAGVLGCRTGPKRSGTPSMGLPHEALRGLARSSDWISAAAVGVLGIGEACAGACNRPQQGSEGGAKPQRHTACTPLVALCTTGFIDLIALLLGTWSHLCARAWHKAEG